MILHMLNEERDFYRGAATNLHFLVQEGAKRSENRRPLPSASPSFAGKALLSSHKHSAQHMSAMSAQKATPALGFRTFWTIEEPHPWQKAEGSVGTA